MADKLTSRIKAGIATVKQWEAEELLLKECRAQIPFHLLYPDQFYHLEKERICDSPYAKEDDVNYKGDDLLLKRLTLYFKQMMTWVNNPPCELCGSSNTKCRHVRGAMTPDEKEGQAGRVEVYWCPTCNAETTLFPRYNHPRKLLETKRGRCGEYANLFGLFCRAAGFETRYISDFTDHVWTEVYSQRLGRWIMCDSCEGVIDAPSMYEKGWGKDLNYILAFTVDSVVDVTRRYTRKFKTVEFQQRRKSVYPGGDGLSEMILAQFNTELRHTQRLSSKHLEELDRRLSIERKFLEATESITSWDATDYSEGRQSGSLSWRMSRGEAGYVSDMVNNLDTQQKIESRTTNMIVLSTEDLRDVTKLRLKNENNVVPSKLLMRLPETIMPLVSQVTASFKVKKEAFMRYMQSEENNTLQNSKPCIGFCSKQGLPIYLIDQSCYPFVKVSNTTFDELNSWKTFHFVPESLATESHDSDSYDFELPVNEDLFSELLGNDLIHNDSGKVTCVETISTLSKCRLIAFYFSAHW
jgi:Transglutaminase-like enzymes, putative cysteine proteases